MPAAAHLRRSGDQHARARRQPGSDAVGMAGVPPQSGLRKLSPSPGASAACLRPKALHAAAASQVKHPAWGIVNQH